jgi:hypothetical protein
MSHYATQLEISQLIGCSAAHISQTLSKGKIPSKFLRKEKHHGKQVIRINTDFVEYYKSKRKKSTVTENAMPASELQQQKLKAEVAKLILQSQRLKHQIAEQEGKYVEVEQHEYDLAQRAIIFKQDLDNLARSKTPELVRITGGDVKLIPDGIQFMLEQIQIILGRYAQ